MHRRRSGGDDHGDRGEAGLGTVPVIGERARLGWAFGAAAGDSERPVVVGEELELGVMARALAVAPFVVVAADLSEVLSFEGEGEVVEELGELSGRLVAEFVGYGEVGQVHSRSSATACSRCSVADTYLRDDDELRGVVNGSQRRSTAYVLRCVGDDHEPRQFVTWCPKAIAGIGAIPDTVLDTAPSCYGWNDGPRMSRWQVGATGTRARSRPCAASSRSGSPTTRRASSRDCRRWSSRPGLHDRARDAWEALLAIGNVAGGELAGRGGRAWRACEHVTASIAGEEAGAPETLLADLRTIFEAEGWPPSFGSKATLDKLTVMEGRPWGEWSRDKPLSAHGLSKLLKPFGVQPRQVRLPDGPSLKGYRRLLERA